MSDLPTTETTKAPRRFGSPGQKVPPFARFKGTSAWRKDRRRAREYAIFRAAQAEAHGQAQMQAHGQTQG